MDVSPLPRSLSVITTPSTRSSRRREERALAPVRIDLDSQSGTYEEPNVWVSYDYQSPHIKKTKAPPINPSTGPMPRLPIFRYD